MNSLAHQPSGKRAAVAVIQPQLKIGPAALSNHSIVLGDSRQKKSLHWAMNQQPIGCNACNQGWDIKTPCVPFS